MVTFSYRLRFACTQARRLWSGLRMCGDVRSYANFDGGGGIISLLGKGSTL